MSAAVPLFEALQHPLRQAVLSYLQQHGTGSSSEIARHLDVRVGNLSYHVRRLAQLGLIEEVRTVRRRGALMRIYQTTVAFREATVAMIREEVVRLATIAPVNTIPAMAVRLDEQALTELGRDMQRVFARVRELHAETATRAERTRPPEPTFETAVLFAITAPAA